ncbi:MAG: NAD(P)/FAD-dependent oxidoreductase [Actinomycetota bacterium]
MSTEHIGVADAVVIGAGAPGTSTAYHLADRGRRVMLVDRSAAVSQTSPRAAGLALQIQADEPLARIAIRSIEMMLRFERDTGHPLTVHQWGSIKVARTEGDERQVHEEIERGRSLGVDVDLIDGGRARTLAPWLDPATAVAMWYSPGDLFLEPGDLPRAYEAAFLKRGGRIVEHAEVTGFEIGTGGIEAVSTSRGTIEAPAVVIAAGAWSRKVGELAGARLPLWPIRHQLLVTEPLREVADGQPSVRIMDAKTYTRPERGGLMFGAYEPDPLQLDMRSEPSSFEIADVPIDERPLRAKIAEVERELPALRTARVAEVRGGLPTMTPDGHFLVDRLPGVSWCYAITGCNVGGLSTSPALGHDLADWMVTGERPPSIEPFSLDRFGPDYDDEDRLRAACFATYAHKYGEDETVAH